MLRRFTRFFALSVFITSYTFSAAQACSAHDKMAYRAVAERFCTFLDGKRQPGTDLFTPSLLKIIAAAQAKNNMIAKAHPDEKPPLGDGIPYQAFPDQAIFCRPGQNLHSEHQLYMEVAYIFPDEPDADWVDHLKLVKVGTDWKIDDIIYGHNHTEHLRVVLQNVLAAE
jgi:hypothetical protein